MQEVMRATGTSSATRVSAAVGNTSNSTRVLLATVQSMRGTLDLWLMPWLTPIVWKFTTTFAIALGITFLIFMLQLILAAHLTGTQSPDPPLPAECIPWIAPLSPAIVPKYFVVQSQMLCFLDTTYPPVHYRTWLPPFDRALFVQRLRGARPE